MWWGEEGGGGGGGERDLNTRAANFFIQDTQSQSLLQNHIVS